MKSSFLTIAVLSVIVSSTMARRLSSLPSNNVHRLGWGLDDDVYFSAPQEVSTVMEENNHHHEEDNIKAVNPVKRVVNKPQLLRKNKEFGIAEKRSRGPWGVPHASEIEDIIGLE